MGTNTAAAWQPGQALFVGFEGLECPRPLLELIGAGRIGGVVLFARNIETPAQVVTLRITSRPSGAEVIRDGEVRGTTPFSEAVPRGTEALRYTLSRAGYETVKLSVTPDDDHRVERELTPIMLLR